MTVEWSDNLAELYPGKSWARISATGAIIFDTKQDFYNWLEAQDQPEKEHFKKEKK